MPGRLRPLVVVLAAALCGAVMSWATDQGRTSVTVVSSARDAIGSLSSPWLIIPLVAGAMCTSLGRGAVLGLVSTMSALSGWYLYAAAAEDLGQQSFLADLRIEFAANRLWFLAGLVSGPIFGVIGAWCRRRGRRRVAVVSGALLVGEPLVMASLTLLHHAGVLSPDRPLPSVFALLSRTWVSGALGASVLAAESVLGVGVLTAAATMRARRIRVVGSPPI